MSGLTDKELQEIYIKNTQGDPRAREKAVSYNLPLVHAICKRYYYLKIVDYDDLFQEGCIGLLKALGKYNPGKGIKFSTYAVPYILGEIRSCLRRNGHLLKISRSYYEQYRRLLKDKEELVHKFKRQPRLEELVEKTGLSGEEITLLMELQSPVMSLQEKIPTPTFSRKGNSIVETDSFLDKLMIQEKLNRLPPRKKRIIILRYIKEKSQQEVAAILGLSQSYVSRLERQALKILKENG
ncbi:MAG: sigma-70 family RNA polymerase sigma factor [Firmicutes bacterium]|nr:sigma-70 family RNA polymerase sigma factor [Bacillota bacterium]